jgi:hypothetical protein
LLLSTLNQTQFCTDQLKRRKAITQFKRTWLIPQFFSINFLTILLLYPLPPPNKVTFVLKKEGGNLKQIQSIQKMNTLLFSVALFITVGLVVWGTTVASPLALEWRECSNLALASTHSLSLFFFSRLRPIHRHYEIDSLSLFCLEPTKIEKADSIFLALSRLSLVEPAVRGWEFSFDIESTLCTD